MASQKFRNLGRLASVTLLLPAFLTLNIALNAQNRSDASRLRQSLGLSNGKDAKSSANFNRIVAEHMAGQDVPTFHNDRARSGIQRRETSLTPSNVNTNQFGKLRSFGVDADVYAQPLYISKYKMADGKLHNVLFVATAHDPISASDPATNNPPTAHFCLASTHAPRAPH